MTLITNALKLPLNKVQVTCLCRITTHGVRPTTGDRIPTLFDMRRVRIDPAEWKSLPLVVDHPDSEWTHNVDAQVGRLIKVVNDSHAIWATALVDIRGLHSRAPHIAEKLWKGEPVETSLGAYHTTVIQSGEYNGESYEAIATETNPHHLAILSQGVGAVGLRNQCGMIRADLSKPLLKRLKLL